MQQQQIDPVIYSNVTYKDITVQLLNFVKIIEELTKENIQLKQELNSKAQDKASKPAKEFKEFDANVETI